MKNSIKLYPFYDDNGKSLDYVHVSEHFTLGEFKNACFHLPTENIVNVPIPLDLLYAMDYLRKTLGKPIIINSHFRTLAYEKQKGRSGRSQHVLGKAVDLRGEGLVELLATAVKEKNEVYKKLREFGVNAIGLYYNFVHIDVRPAKILGGLYYWDDRGKKKKRDDDAVIDWSLWGVVGISLLVILKIFSYVKKNRK